MPVFSLQHDSLASHFRGLHPFVRKCGNDRRGPWALRRRVLLDYLVVYMKEGYGRFSLGDRSWIMEEGDVFWVPPGRICSMESRSRTMVCPFIHFDLIYRIPGSHWEMHIPDGITDVSPWAQLMHPPLPEDSAFSQLGGVYRVTHGDYICALIEEICRDAAMMRPSFQAEQAGRMFLLLSAVLREVLAEEQADAVVTERLLRLSDYLKDHLSQATAASCASFCGFSESYFRKVFARVYGTSPRTYLTRMRIRRSAELLAHTSKGLDEIGQAVGYAHAGNFSRVFTRHMGISPGAYRRGMAPGREIS